jgi:hypothetical protein
MNGHWTDRAVSRLPRLSAFVAKAFWPVYGDGRTACREVKVRRPSRHHHGETGMNLVLNPPLLGFIVGTRAALAFGVGLLLADRIPESRRRRIALTLIGIGAATTIPAAMALGRGQDRRRLHPVAP